MLPPASLPAAPNPAAVLHAALLRSSPSRLPPRLSFNSLLAAASTSSHPRLRSLAIPALTLAHRCPAAVGPLDSYALCSALRHASSAEAGPLHALAARSGWLGSVFVSCALAASYGGSGRFLDARRLFDESPVRNGAFGNAVLAAYVGAGKWTPALEFARRFPEFGLPADGYTMTAVVRACGEMANADLGGETHGHAIRRVGGVGSDVFLISALVDMYAKCGLVGQSERVFRLALRANAGGDVVLWTAMLNAYGRHGQCKEVIQTYDQMVAFGVWPDDLAILAVLSACHHAGEVAKGLKYFESMCADDYGLVPTPEHYGCVVNMLCRAGEVARAWEIATREECGGNIGVSTWGALLSACCDCRNVELGRLAARKAIELEPRNVGIYVELSNLYASAGLWEEINKLREVMKDRGFEKDVGSTCLEQNS